MTIEYIQKKIEQYRQLNEEKLVELWETCLRSKLVEIKVSN